MDQLAYFNSVAKLIGALKYVSNVEAVELNSSFAANTAAFDLLAAVANTFYYLDYALYRGERGNAAGGVPNLDWYNLAAAAQTMKIGYIVGSVGDPNHTIESMVCTRLRYDPNGCTSAALVQWIGGTVYKITYTQ